MTADEILKKHEDANEMHFHEVDRKWIIEAMEKYAALRQQSVSGELNCEHNWLVEYYDHFGFPASMFCDKCNTREAI